MRIKAILALLALSALLGPSHGVSSSASAHQRALLSSRVQSNLELQSRARWFGKKFFKDVGKTLGDVLLITAKVISDTVSGSICELGNGISGKHNSCPNPSDDFRKIFNTCEGGCSPSEAMHSVCGNVMIGCYMDAISVGMMFIMPWLTPELELGEAVASALGEELEAITVSAAGDAAGLVEDVAGESADAAAMEGAADVAGAGDGATTIEGIEAAVEDAEASLADTTSSADASAVMNQFYETLDTLVDGIAAEEEQVGFLNDAGATPPGEMGEGVAFVDFGAANAGNDAVVNAIEEATGTDIGTLVDGSRVANAAIDEDLEVSVLDRLLTSEWDITPMDLAERARLMAQAGSGTSRGFIPADVFSVIYSFDAESIIASASRAGGGGSLLQVGLRGGKKADCTQAGQDPFATGTELPCCGGLYPVNRQWGGPLDHGDYPYYFRCAAFRPELNLEVRAWRLATKMNMLGYHVSNIGSIIGDKVITQVTLEDFVASSGVKDYESFMSEMDTNLTLANTKDGIAVGAVGTNNIYWSKNLLGNNETKDIYRQLWDDVATGYAKIVSDSSFSTKSTTPYVAEKLDGKGGGSIGFIQTNNDGTVKNYVVTLSTLEAAGYCAAYVDDDKELFAVMKASSKKGCEY